jgi:pimeloyl-ACP methyl ester carboxylesterase
MISSQSAEGYAATCEAVCGETHVDPDYAAIQCPTVLIVGAQDDISRLSRSEELNSLIGRGGKSSESVIVHSSH